MSDLWRTVQTPYAFQLNSFVLPWALDELLSLPRLLSLFLINEHMIGRFHWKQTLFIIMPCQDIFYVMLDWNSKNTLHILLPKKTDFINWAFQSPLTGSINSDARLNNVWPFGVIGHQVTPSGIQGSNQMSICVPSPTLQIKPSFSALIPWTILRQEYEMTGFSTTPNRLPSGKYFALNTWAQSESGFASNLHHCLASIAGWIDVDPWKKAHHSLSVYTVSLLTTNAFYSQAPVETTKICKSLC